MLDKFLEIKNLKTILFISNYLSLSVMTPPALPQGQSLFSFLVKINALLCGLKIIIGSLFTFKKYQKGPIQIFRALKLKISILLFFLFKVTPLFMFLYCMGTQLCFKWPFEATIVNWNMLLRRNWIWIQNKLFKSWRLSPSRDLLNTQVGI